MSKIQAPLMQSKVDYPRVILNKGRELSVLRFHPWVFSGAVKGITRPIEAGEVAEIFSCDGKYLATGHFEGSSIAVKIFSYNRQIIDAGFWKEKLQNAYNLRQALNLTQQPHTNAYRLVFTEGDGLPGLIVDNYAGNMVIQTQSLGMFNARQEISQALLEIYDHSLSVVYDKSPADFYNSTSPNRMLYGSSCNVVEILENNHHFRVDIEKGQKTGFFLDQRDNRMLLARYAANRKVLNLFSYTGGFSIYALKANAQKVISVDSSAPAITMANENITINALDSSKHQGVVADVKQYIANMPEDFDLVILDPPAFAKHQTARHKAMLGYRYLNETVLKKMPPGGILFTFSCSQVVSQEMFQSTVMAAAIAAGRQVRVLHKLTQPPDHPAVIFHPEGEYLKGLVLYVE